MSADVSSGSSMEVEVIEPPQPAYKSLGGLRGGASASHALKAYKKTADPSWRAPFNPDWDPRVALDSTVGFPNTEDQCFRNVTLQMLLHLPIFLNWLKWYRQHHVPDGQDCTLGEEGFECKPCTFCALAEGYWDSTAYDYREELENLWSRVFPDWDEGTRSGQQDSIEFLPELLGQLREQTRDLFKSDLDDIFSIPTVTHRQCLQPSSCRPTYTLDKSNVLMVRFPGDASQPEPIQNMINASFAENVIANGGCSTCRKQRATREYLGHPPEVLLVHLNRVVYEQGQMQKITQCVTFEEKITLSKEFFDPRLNAAKDIEYELSSVQLHAGASPQEGHYRILAKGRSGGWTFFDDDCPGKKFSSVDVTASKGVQKQAYVFAYRRLPVKPPAQRKPTTAKVVQAKPNVKSTTGGGFNKLMSVDMNAVQQRLLREKSTQPDTSSASGIEQQTLLAKSALDNAALLKVLKETLKEKAELEKKLAEKDALLALTTSSATAGDASDPLNGTMALVFKTANGQIALDLSIDGNIRKLQSLPLRAKEVIDPDQPMESIEFDKPTDSTTGKGGKQGKKSTTKDPRTPKNSSKKRKGEKDAEGPRGKNGDESDKRRKTG